MFFTTVFHKPFFLTMILNVLWKYVTFKTLGNVFGIDGSSVRRLIMKRFKELSSDGVKTRRQKLKESELPIRQRYGYRFLKPEHI